METLSQLDVVVYVYELYEGEPLESDLIYGNDMSDEQVYEWVSNKHGEHANVISILR